MYTSELQELHASLQAEGICVIFLLIDFVFEMKVPSGREFIVKISASAEKIRDF